MIFSNSRYLYLLPVLLLFPIFLSGQETSTYTLKQAQDYALENNYKNKNARREIEIAEKKVWETTAIGLPQVNAEAQLQKFIDVPINLAPANSFNPMAPADELVELQFGLNYSNSVGITASQLLFDGAYIVGLQAAKTYKELSLNNQIKTEIETRDNVAQAYYTVLATMENIAVMEKSLESSEKILKETRAFYEEGFTDEQSLDQFTLNTNTLKTSLGIAKGQRGFAEKLLKLQMGLDVNSPIELAENLETLLEKARSEGVSKQNFSVTGHVDYNLAETNVALMELSLRKEKYSFLPSLGAFFNHQQQNMNNTFDVFSGGTWYPSTVLGANLKLPILSSGARLSKVSQAKLELEKAQESAKEAEQGLIYQAQLAKSNFNTADETFNDQKDNLVLAEKIYEKTIKKYNEGISSSMDLTQAQTQMLSAQGAYIKSALDLLNAISNMEKSYGKK